MKKKSFRVEFWETGISRFKTLALNNNLFAVADLYIEQVMCEKNYSIPFFK